MGKSTIRLSKELGLCFLKQALQVLSQKPLNFFIKKSLCASNKTVPVETLHNYSTPKEAVPNGAIVLMLSFL